MTGNLSAFLRHWTPTLFTYSCRYDAQDAGCDGAQPTTGRGNVRHRTRMQRFTVVLSTAFFSEAHAQAPNFSFGAVASPQRLPLHVKHPASESGLSSKPSLQRVGRCGSPLKIYGMLPTIATSAVTRRRLFRPFVPRFRGTIGALHFSSLRFLCCFACSPIDETISSLSAVPTQRSR